MGTPVSSWAFGIEGDKDICVSPKFKMNPTKGTFWGGTPLKGQSPLRLLGGSIFLPPPWILARFCIRKICIGLIFLWCWRWVKRFHFLLRTKSLLPALQANCHQKSGLSCQECGPVTGTIFFVPPFTFSFGVPRLHGNLARRLELRLVGLLPRRVSANLPEDSVQAVHQFDQSHACGHGFKLL